MLTGQAEPPAHPPHGQRSPGTRQLSEGILWPGWTVPINSTCRFAWACTLHCFWSNGVILAQHFAATHSCLLDPYYIYLLFASYCQTHTANLNENYAWAQTRSYSSGERRGREGRRMTAFLCPQFYTWGAQNSSTHKKYTEQVTEVGHVQIQVFEDHTCLLSSGIVFHSGQQDTCQPAFYLAKLVHLLQTPLYD